MNGESHGQEDSIGAVPPAAILRMILGALGATVVFGLAAEAVQAALEYGRLAADPVFHGWNAPHGDGRPVIAIPGFLGSDGYLGTLRGWLGRIGYRPFESGLRRNTGFNAALLAEIEQRTVEASRASREPVALIGHSLGGVYARAIARLRPELVGDVIALGSPLGLDAGPIPASVRFTAIYTRADRIVRYPRALAPGPGARNVEAGGSHVGMAFNADVYRAIAFALAASRPSSSA